MARTWRCNKIVKGSVAKVFARYQHYVEMCQMGGDGEHAILQENLSIQRALKSFMVGQQCLSRLNKTKQKIKTCHQV